MSLALGTLQTVTSVLATDTHIHTLPLILVCSLSRHFARFMVGGYAADRPGATRVASGGCTGARPRVPMAGWTQPTPPPSPPLLTRGWGRQRAIATAVAAAAVVVVVAAATGGGGGGDGGNLRGGGGGGGGDGGEGS